jgi:cytochrome c
VRRSPVRYLIAAGLVQASLLPGAAQDTTAGDAARGERAFQRCYACHSVDPGEKAKLQGPSLYRVLGRPAGALPGFDYSEAMRSKGAGGLVWDAGTLDSYIADPDAVVPGTAMSAPPLGDEQERADIIAFLARSGLFAR